MGERGVIFFSRRLLEKGRFVRACVATLTGCLWLGVSPVWAISSQERFDTVVIDAGHGGEDAGARSHAGLSEKDVVLDVSRRLARRLRAQGLTVALTRTDDEFVPLEVRTAIANDAGGDLFISVHANSARNTDARGIETYFVSLEASDELAERLASRENQAFDTSATRIPQRQDPLVALLGDMIATEHVNESSEFSKLVQGQLIRRTGEDSRGVKQAPFVVLMGVQMPASLIEIGFLSNLQDEQNLAAVAHRNALVEAVARAVEAFGKRYDARRGVGRDVSVLRGD
ncbi:MAG: N-acetylmuramoyl-L-alanine amidase [Myxococcota bacterium]